MEKKEKLDKKHSTQQSDVYDSIYFNNSGSVSSCECTGMMYVPPQNEDERESYSDLFGLEVESIKQNGQNDRT